MVPLGRSGAGKAERVASMVLDDGCAFIITDLRAMAIDLLESAVRYSYSGTFAWQSKVDGLWVLASDGGGEKTSLTVTDTMTEQSYGFDIPMSLTRGAMNDYGKTDLIKSLVDLVKGSENKFRIGDRILDPSEIDTYVKDYIFADSQLTEIYTKDFFPDPVELSYLRDGLDGQKAYYCPNCGKKLGYTADALYVKETAGGVSKRVRKCPYCKLPL